MAKPHPEEQLRQVLQHMRTVLASNVAGGRPDAELIKRYVSNRDEAAFGALVRRHGPMVFGVCSRILRDTHDAEDAFQATFLVLVRKAASLRSPHLIGNWLYGVACRTALQARQAAAKRRARETEAAAMVQPACDTWAELRPLLDQELKRLSDKYRALVVLCDLEGRTRKEAAALLGLPEGTVASRLHAARKMLARRLTKRGLVVSEASLSGALSAAQASAVMPLALAKTTLKAAALFAAGHSLAEAIPASVVALTEGVLKIMLLTKLKTMAVVLVTCALLSTSAAGVAYHVAAGQQAGDGPGQTTIVDTPGNAAQVGGQQTKDLNEQVARLRDENEALRKQVQDLQHRLQSTVEVGVQRTQELSEAVARVLVEHEQLKNKLAVGEKELAVARKLLKDQQDDKPPELNVYVIGPLKYAAPSDLQALVSFIKRAVDPFSWDREAGGIGGGVIEYFPATNTIAVNNSKAVYEKVHNLVSLFEDMHRAKAPTERKFQQKVHNVSDLASQDGTSLIRVITNTIERESWVAAGGLGSIEYYPEGKSLVVRNTDIIQGRIEALLADLRKSKADQETKKSPRD